ncbi:hypothetical protein K1719_004059 [Acacia pycnantha]|nr:hypothetical protein K1719_004059 [Acacia pycnantha]
MVGVITHFNAEILCPSPKDLPLLLLFLAPAFYLFDDTVFFISTASRTLFSVHRFPRGSLVLVCSLQDTGIRKSISQVNVFVSSLEPSHLRSFAF